MRQKKRLLFLCLAVILLASFITVISNNLNPFQGKLRGLYRPGVSEEADRAVNQARKVYQEKKLLGVDFSEGPCLTNDLLPDWVLDIAHSPRIEKDNLPKNQCQAFLEGRATHFVEMDEAGNIIQVW